MSHAYEIADALSARDAASAIPPRISVCSPATGALQSLRDTVNVYMMAHHTETMDGVFANSVLEDIARARKHMDALEAHIKAAHQ